MSTVVFTAILGGSDSLKPAPTGADRCVCFVDDPTIYSGQTRGWELVKHRPSCSECDGRGVYLDAPAIGAGTYWSKCEKCGGAGKANHRREAWHLRCIPHVFFPEADHTVWIDASFTVTDLPRLLKDSEGHDLSGLRHQARNTCWQEGLEVVRVGQSHEADVTRQLQKYHQEGFAPVGLTIACIIVRANNAKATAFNETWDREVRAHAGDNTQLSIDYAAWKAGLKWHYLKGVRKDNPYSTHDHRDHKRRRQPYRMDFA